MTDTTVVPPQADNWGKVSFSPPSSHPGTGSETMPSKRAFWECPGYCWGPPRPLYQARMSGPFSGEQSHLAQMSGRSRTAPAPLCILGSSLPITADCEVGGGIRSQTFGPRRQLCGAVHAQSPLWVRSHLGLASPGLGSVPPILLPPARNSHPR